MTIAQRAASTERSTTGRLGGPGEPREQEGFSSLDRQAQEEYEASLVNAFSESLLADAARESLTFFAAPNQDGQSDLLVASPDGSWFIVDTVRFADTPPLLGLRALPSGVAPVAGEDGAVQLDHGSARTVLYSLARAAGCEFVVAEQAAVSPVVPLDEMLELREEVAAEFDEYMRPELPELWREVVGDSPRPAARGDFERMRPSDFAVLRKAQAAELAAIAAGGRTLSLTASAEQGAAGALVGRATRALSSLPPAAQAVCAAAGSQVGDSVFGSVPVKTAGNAAAQAQFALAVNARAVRVLRAGGVRFLAGVRS